MKKLKYLFYAIFISLTSSAQMPELQWSKAFGGTADDYGMSIKATKGGNIYSSGLFRDTVDFDPGVGEFKMATPSYDACLFITKLDPKGMFIWAKGLGFGGTIKSHNLYLDDNNNIYIIGDFKGTSDFDPGPSTAFLFGTGDQNSFITKLDSSGNFIWAKSFIGKNLTYSENIAFTKSGGVLIAGGFRNTVDFDPGSGIYNMTTSSTSHDAFVMELDTNGKFVWAKQIGSNDVNEFCDEIICDSEGNIILSGVFTGISDFDPGPGTFFLNSGSPTEGQHMFVMKLDASKNFLWAKAIGGPSNNFTRSTGLVIDDLDNINITGTFNKSTDFDPNSGINNLAAIGSFDAFLLQLDKEGNLNWAKNFGGAASNLRSRALFIDKMNDLYIVGQFAGNVDFDAGAGKSLLTSIQYDAFLTKYNNSGNFVYTNSWGSNQNDECSYVFVDASQSIYTIGYFHDIADFDPSIKEYFDTSFGRTDVFISKMTQPSTSIVPKKIETSLSVFPNPSTNGVFTILVNKEFEGENARVFNVFGQVVKTFKIEKSNIISLNQGIYFLDIQNKNEKIMQQLIVIQ